MNDRLSPIEAIMWRVGQDATLRMTVGALVLLDRAPTAAALAARVASVAQAPPLRRRPDDPTFTRTRPAWVDDPDPDTGYHLRSAAVASPGSQRQMLDTVALLESIPFDPERPPWDLTLIEGLEGGRAALYLRAHHAITDGLGGIRLVTLLLDEPEKLGAVKAEPKPVELVEPEPAPTNERRRGTVTIDFTKAVHPLAAGVNAARDVETLDFVVRGFQRALEVANSVSRQVMVTGGPLSPLPPARSMISRFEVISFPGAKHAAIALGGSRNDLLVAVAAGGLGLYHDRLGQPSAELRLATPARQRSGDEVGGNWFAPARVEVPTATGHPGRQFGVIADRLAQARSEPALRLTAALASAISRLPTRMLLPALHAQADSVDFAATTLPGLRGSRHICGSFIEASYPFGPRLGCPLNLTAFGNADRLDVGIALDPGAITEPEVLLGCILEAYHAYVPAAEESPVADRVTKGAKR
jgi:diacylglycerol O-acyltransferase